MKIRRISEFVLAAFVTASLIFVPLTVLGAETKNDSTTIYIIADNGLNIREKASKKSKVITTVSYGTKLKSIGKIKKDKKWVKIKYKNKIRYVRSAYISKKKPKKNKANTSKAKYSDNSFKRMGVIHWESWRWTWYSQRVLPGGGLKIPGRHVDSNGYVCDKNNYICLASSTLSKGTILDTPFGKQGKIYDSGCARGTIDVYVNW